MDVGAGNQSTWPDDKAVRLPPTPPERGRRRLRRAQQVVAVLPFLAAVAFVVYSICLTYEQHRGVDPYDRIHELRSKIEEAGVHCAAWSEVGHNRLRFSSWLVGLDNNVDGECRLNDGLQLRLATFREHLDMALLAGEVSADIPCPRIEGDAAIWIDMRGISDGELLRQLDALREENRWSYVTSC